MKFIYLMENEQSASPPLKSATKDLSKPLTPPQPRKPLAYIPKVEKGVRDYCKLLGLRREPFSMAPEPDLFYESKEHTQCINRLEISLRLNRGLHVVTGGVGTGKTTLSRLLLDRFTDYEGDYTFFLILNPTWRNNQEFLMYFKKMFNITDESNLVTDMMNQIEHFLIDYALNYSKRIVVIIDEGQKLGPNQIEIIRTLLNFETNSTKLIQFAIFAQPEFHDTINAIENFKDRIAYSHNIQAMDEEDTRNFITHRLTKAGLPRGKEIFSDSAKNLIYKYTHGYPRKIVVTCHNLLIDMLITGKSKVDADLVFQLTRDSKLLYE